MEIIKPTEVLNKVFLIIDDAKEFAVMVSPAYNFYKWDSFLQRIESAKKRNIKLSFWGKEPEKKEEQVSIGEVESLGYKPRLIKKLNVKMYFNEKEAIVCSMNLTLGADASLDFAFKTQTKVEYEQVMDFYEKYIKVDGANLVYDTNAFLEDIDNALVAMFPKNVRIQFDGSIIQINAKGRYKVSILEEKGNNLKLNCILSDEEYEHLQKTKMSMFNKGNLDIALEKGADKYHQFIWGTLHNVKSGSLDRILDSEADELRKTIVAFIASVKEMKAYVEVEMKKQK